MAKNSSSSLVESISITKLMSPKKIINQKIRINGLSLEVARPSNLKRLSSRFKSLF